MIRFYVGERWKEFSLGFRSKFRYAVSNYGRVMSFTRKMKDGNLMKGGRIQGYKILHYKFFRKKKPVWRHLFFHHLVANNFLRKKSPKYGFILHMDYDKENNSVENLRWATKTEMIEHHKSNPMVIAAKKRLLKMNRERGGMKLTAANVRTIKKILKNRKRRITYKKLARRYRITTMTLHRIKTGENWGHVK